MLSATWRLHGRTRAAEAVGDGHDVIGASLDGEDRMRIRPIGLTAELLSALISVGCSSAVGGGYHDVDSGGPPGRTGPGRAADRDQASAAMRDRVAGRGRTAALARGRGPMEAQTRARGAPPDRAMAGAVSASSTRWCTRAARPTRTTRASSASRASAPLRGTRRPMEPRAEREGRSPPGWSVTVASA